MHGHIAARLRAFLQEKQWTVRQLNEALGLQREYSGVYNWLNAKGPPGKKAATKLAKLLGVPIAELRPHRGGGVPPPSLPVPVRTLPATRPADVLSFNVQADGEARIRLDVTLPVSRATPLLRLLLDHVALGDTTVTS
jgi:transcriptional regulator with XRE-family HTH domain